MQRTNLKKTDQRLLTRRRKSGIIYTNKHGRLVERSGEYVLSGFSNDDLYVYGHGYADAHVFVRSFAAFPEHPGSNVFLLNGVFTTQGYAERITHLKRGAFELPAFLHIRRFGVG